MKFTERLMHGWNAFRNKEPSSDWKNYGSGYFSNPTRTKLSYGSDKTIIASLYNRIAIDIASINIQHVRKDQNGNMIETIKSGLNNCLTVETNIDQSARAFILDVVLSLFDEGVIALVPIETNVSIMTPGAFDVQTLRVGKITQWYPQHVRVKVYNELTGVKQELVFPKANIGIIENPLYSIMNEPNTMLKRLTRKLALLDAVDEQQGSGKLDLIIQLPYIIKSDARKQQAETRRKDIEMQLKSSQYGVAYTDGTEKVTQLNRPIENQLLKQVEWLTATVYAQLGISQQVFDGTADEKTMLNYYSRTVEPVLSAITDEIERKFISKTARTQGQGIMFFRDPFRLVPMSDLAELADKLTRNEILTKNEFRAIIGYQPSDDPRADELRNSNIAAANDGMVPEYPPEEEEYYPEEEEVPYEE